MFGNTKIVCNDKVSCGKSSVKYFTMNNIAIMYQH